jgi:hypothetical protein
MSNNDKLTKKERKYYSTLLAKKLESLGIKDEIVLSGTGAGRLYYKTGNDGKRLLDKNGKPETIVMESLSAKNPFRAMIKNLRNGSRDAIESFLGLDTKPLVIPEPAPEVKAPSQDGILIEPVTEAK